MTTTTREVLEAAADIIAERGWCRGLLRDAEGRVCLVGAVQTATIKLGVTQLQPDAIDCVRQELDERSVFGVPDWNDNQAETAEEVILVLKKAAGRTPDSRVYGDWLYDA